MLRLLAWWSVVLSGCAKVPVSIGDPTLPEQADSVEALPALEVLERGAHSVVPAARARAVDLLIAPQGPGGMVEVDPVSAVQRARVAFADESEWVRGAAVDALGRRSDPESRALLETWAADPAADAFLRARAALYAPGAPSLAAVQQALGSERELFRLAPLALAAVRLGAGGEGTPARDILVRAVEQGALPLDLGFIRELGRGQDAWLVEPLRRAEEVAEPELALPLACARLSLGDSLAESAIRRALGDPDQERRMEAVDYLVEVEGAASTALIRRATIDGPELVTRYAELALAARGVLDPATFSRALAAEDRELRQLAVHLALRVDLTDRRALREVERTAILGLVDRDSSVRAGAARLAGEAGVEGARPQLTALLADETELVRVEAAGALRALDAARSVKK